MSDVHEILDPNELIGDVVLRAQTAANTAGETMTITIHAGERLNALRCVHCDYKTPLEDVDGISLQIEVRGWESQYVSAWVNNAGQLMVRPDWMDGPEETDWTGKAEYECLSCGRSHAFEFDAVNYVEREAQFGAALFALFQPYYDEEYE